MLLNKEYVSADGRENGLFNSKKYQLKLNTEYYALAQVARFIRPGAKVIHHRVEDSTAVRALTAVNEDRSLIVVLRNPEPKAQPLRVQIAANTQSVVVVEVPARSAITLQMQQMLVDRQSD